MSSQQIVVNILLSMPNSRNENAISLLLSYIYIMYFSTLYSFIINFKTLRLLKFVML